MLVQYARRNDRKCILPSGGEFPSLTATRNCTHLFHLLLVAICTVVMPQFASPQHLVQQNYIREKGSLSRVSLVLDKHFASSGLLRN